MSKDRKYSTQIVQQDSGWNAAIIRRVTARKTTVTKSRDGFASEAEATDWAATELASLLKTLAERNQRRAR